MSAPGPSRPCVGGYDADHFTEWDQAIKDELQCSICLCVCRDACQLEQCGHLFCEMCITNIREGVCPDCRCVIGPNDIKPDRHIRRKIESARIHCLVAGCAWTGTFRGMTFMQHMQIGHAEMVVPASTPAIVATVPNTSCGSSIQHIPHLPRYHFDDQAPASTSSPPPQQNPLFRLYSRPAPQVSLADIARVPNAVYRSRQLSPNFAAAHREESEFDEEDDDDLSVSEYDESGEDDEDIDGDLYDDQCIIVQAGPFPTILIQSNQGAISDFVSPVPASSSVGVCVSVGSKTSLKDRQKRRQCVVM